MEKAYTGKLLDIECCEHITQSLQNSVRDNFSFIDFQQTVASGRGDEF